MTIKLLFTINGTIDLPELKSTNAKEEAEKLLREMLNKSRFRDRFQDVKIYVFKSSALWWADSVAFFTLGTYSAFLSI